VNSSADGRTPLLVGKAHGQPSVFRPENLLREGRRQRQLPDQQVPAVCLLDPDGDVVRHLADTGQGRLEPGWACYHTQMWTTDVEGLPLGVVGCAVGAPFAVLVAEQLAASGATLVVSITSAGQLAPLAEPPYFVLIDRALRDEGTSLHYQPASTWAHLPSHLAAALTDLGTHCGVGDPGRAAGRSGMASSTARPWAGTMISGASWTTDAPYRETETAIAAAVEAGTVCVEMEAAALYAYASARMRDVVCIAHVTNAMAVDGDDFEKGDANGVTASLALAAAVARAVVVHRAR
jgi:uridine phosphorylase